MMGRLDSGPNTVVRCVGRDRLRDEMEPIAAPAGEFVVATTLNPLDADVRT